MRSRSTLRARSLYNDRINRNLSSWPVAGPVPVAGLIETGFLLAGGRMHGLPDDNMLPTCCRRVKSPLTRSEPTTRTGLNAPWVKPPLLSFLQGRQ